MHSRQDILYSRARQIMQQRYTQKRPWFDMAQCLEQTDADGYSSTSLHEDKNMRTIESLVICENYFSTKPIEIKKLSTDQFWDYLYSGEWDGANSIRVLRGELLRLLMHCVVYLQRQEKIVAHTTFAYAKNILPITGCCYRNKDMEPTESIQETILIEFTNFGRLMKPLPNRPIDDLIPIRRQQSHHALNRSKKIKENPETIILAKTLSSHAFSDVLSSRGPILVPSALKDTKLLSPGNNEMTSKKKEEDAVKPNLQQSAGNLTTALYLGDQIGPSAIQIMETAATKLKRRKKELLKERKQRKSLTKEHELGTKPSLPKLEPLDQGSIRKKHYYYPILSYDTVPTLEQLIQYIKEEEYLDPRFKIDKHTYKIKKLIHKYNLNPDAIKKKLRNTKRRPAMNPTTYNYSWGEYLKKRYASSLERDVDDEWNDNITEDKENLPELSFSKRHLMIQTDFIDAEKHLKPKQTSPDEGSAYPDALEEHERLNKFTEQSKDFQDDSSKTLVTPVDVDNCLVDVTRVVSITPAVHNSIPEIEIISTSENVEYQLTSAISSSCIIESTKDSHLSGLTDSQSEPNTMMLDIKIDTSTDALASYFSDISVINEENDIISDSSEESNVVQEQEELPKKKFDTTKLNPKYSDENIRKQRRLKKNNGVSSNILKKNYGFQGSLKSTHVGKPVNDKSQARTIARKLKIGPRLQFIERMPAVIGKLRSFKFLSKVSPSKKVFVSSPVSFHFPCSSTEKFALRLYQALDDFVVRRESVMSNKKKRYCATVTFTRKSVFSIHQNWNEMKVGD
ncbi:hypothetical protein ACJMK2_035204 [Sinanodonta woodiana]|uniref:Uncharacterized protein n=1 Tax=Sinanodonta woodiana TaxID=1069815 RepID=A0ABD3WU46_SINWO